MVAPSDPSTASLFLKIESSVQATPLDFSMLLVHFRLALEFAEDAGDCGTAVSPNPGEAAATGRVQPREGPALGALRPRARGRSSAL